MRLVVQLWRFSLVGVINTVVDLVVLNAETLVTGIKEGSGFAVQKALSFTVAATISYLLNKRWTFQDTSATGQKKKFAHFFTVSVIGAVINVSVATAVVTYGKVLVHQLFNQEIFGDQIWVNVGALCGTAVGVIWNFLGYKFFVFRA